MNQYTESNIAIIVMELEKRDKFKQKRAEQEEYTAEKDLDLTLRCMIDELVNKFKEEDKIRALIAKDLEGKLVNSPPKKAVKKPPVDPYAIQSQTLILSNQSFKIASTITKRC